jgi:hypothetical protein
MVKDVSDGFSICPPPSLRMRVKEQNEKKRRRYGTKWKNLRNPFILADHWLSAKINRN